MKLEARLSNPTNKYGEGKRNSLNSLQDSNGNEHHQHFFSISTSTKTALSPSSSHAEHAFEEMQTSPDKETCLDKFTSCRWVIGYVCCAARFAQNSIRQCIGMAIVCMTLQHDRHGQGSSESSSVDVQASPGKTESLGSGPGLAFHNKTLSTEANSTLDDRMEFQWSPEFEALILNAFNIGFFLSPIIGGHLSGKLGGKRVMVVSLLVGSSFTICLPLTAHLSDLFIFIMRLLAGLFLGVVDPAIQSLWAKWAPQHEKGRLTTLSFTGVSLAGIVTFFISAHLCSVPVSNGWPFIFYFFGGFGLLCTIPLIFLVYDSPDQHPRILDYEKELIAKGKKPGMNDQKFKTPWRSMLTSGPFWAIVVSHATYSWVTSWIMSYLPKYLKDRMLFDVKEDGLYSSLPYVGRLVAGFLCGSLSDRLLQSGRLTTGQCRKLFQVVGCVGCAVCMLIVGFLDQSERAGAVVLLVLALAFQNFTSVAFRINHLDIAPRFAGVMMGMTLTAAMAFSLTGPPITAALVENDGQEEWLGVFIIVASLNIIGAIIFFVFGSGEVQPWAIPPKSEDQPVVSVVVIGGKNIDTFINDTDRSESNTGERISLEHQVSNHWEKDVSNIDDIKNLENAAPETVDIHPPNRSPVVEESGQSSSESDDFDSASDDEQREIVTDSSPIVTQSPHKRPLTLTTSMPVQHASVLVHKHSLLRKRISSSDVHQKSAESKLRYSAVPNPPPSTHHQSSSEKTKP